MPEEKEASARRSTALQPFFFFLLQLRFLEICPIVQPYALMYAYMTRCTPYRRMHPHNPDRPHAVPRLNDA